MERKYKYIQMLYQVWDSFVQVHTSVVHMKCSSVTIFMILDWQTETVWVSKTPTLYSHTIAITTSMKKEFHPFSTAADE